MSKKISITIFSKAQVDKLRWFVLSNQQSKIQRHSVNDHRRLKKTRHSHLSSCESKFWTFWLEHLLLCTIINWLSKLLPMNFLYWLTDGLIISALVHIIHTHIIFSFQIQLKHLGSLLLPKNMMPNYLEETILYYPLCHTSHNRHCKHTAYLRRTWSKCSLSCAQRREMQPYMTVSPAVLTNTARGRTWWIPVNWQATGKSNI